MSIESKYNIGDKVLYLRNKKELKYYSGSPYLYNGKKEYLQDIENCYNVFAGIISNIEISKNSNFTSIVYKVNYLELICGEILKQEKQYNFNIIKEEEIICLYNNKLKKEDKKYIDYSLNQIYDNLQEELANLNTYYLKEKDNIISINNKKIISNILEIHNINQ